MTHETYLDIVCFFYFVISLSLKKISMEVYILGWEVFLEVNDGARRHSEIKWTAEFAFSSLMKFLLNFKHQKEPNYWDEIEK